MEPVALAPNQLHRFYKGGARIAALRSSGNDDPYAPEEWIGSTASPFGEPGVGVALLPHGRSLDDAVADDPKGYLGAEHVARFGTDLALLVKLLDAGERLPVHFHPDDAFAREHLGSPWGKTEAWIILDAEPGASVHIGFRERVDPATVRGWVDAQDVPSMMAALNEVHVAAGTTVFVPAGTPHIIGAGILLAELQQPTDLSILLEWEGFEIDGPKDGHLGLGFDLALSALDHHVWTDEELQRARSTRPGSRDENVVKLFPAEADRFFRAQRSGDGARLDASFSILLVVGGSGSLKGRDWELALERGDAVLVPHSAGGTEVKGPVDILRCLPPDAAARA
ncbi:MAG: mannose-6-phosphate isomerase [Actinomycetota bacterium]|nr:mannose-6-phosphate isomerase [Actinomycetota bacterium]